jgi:nucleoid-associated protein YgaU
MGRLMRGLGSLAVLLLGTVGAPVALAFLGGNPLPGELTWSAVRQALFVPADGMILVGLITIVGWLAWLVFALSVISELVSIISRKRIRIRLPGLDAPQRYAAGLLISVITMISVPYAVQADPHSDRQVAAAPRTPESAALITEPIETAPHSPRPAAPRAERADDIRRQHVVQPGDDLWSLAERYYGNGRDWRKIAASNPTVLSGGPDRLQVGWRLKIPELDEGVAHKGDRVITVRRGDTLSSIAERELGAAARWTDIFHANRAQLSDPDELTVGMRLLVPQPKKPAAEATPKAHDQTRQTQPSPLEHQRPALPAESSAPAIQPTRIPSSQPEPSSPTATTDTAPVVGISAVSLVGAGGLLAAGVIGGLAWRRRIQLQTRPPGRRIVHPPLATRPVEVALGRRQRPLSLRTLDRAMRAIAAHCRASDIAPPPLQLALIGDNEIELRMQEARSDAPVGFTVHGRSWFLAQDDVEYLKSVPGLSEAARPWPALVTLGRDEQNRLVLGDLESFGLLELQSGSGFPAADLLAAMAVELSFSPWADEMILTLVGGGDRLPEALGKHNVYRTDDCDALIDRLEQRAAVQRENRRYPVLSQHRIDPDFADPWAPEIILVEQPLTAAQSTRLKALIDTEPKVTLAVVVVGPAPGAAWSLQSGGSSADRRVVLRPADLTLSPQWLEPPELTAVVDLIETTGSDDTTPAPWWSDIEVQPDPPPDNVTYLDSRSTWGTANTAERALIMEAAMDPDRTVHHPILQMLGPIELHGATGTEPARAAKQCLEYCAWLLENPGSTAQAMVAALAVAEGTRRSNMSRLRSWLGANAAGEAYLPDAYTGRITLHPAVSSDWHRLQILTATGVNRASDDSLQAALELVRGAPLADAAPGQWHWAEELRTDMISCVRDIGLELADRALLAGNLERARWAAARALLAAPGDELLLAARIRTEHTAGNAAETERLTLQLAAQARTLGVDLNPDTVSLLQRVMEGQVRARLA